MGQIYLGGAAFCDRMQALVSAKQRSREHPRAQRIFVRPALEAIVELVAETFGTTDDALRRKSRGPARKALAQLALDDRGLTVRCVAEWMGVSDWAVSKMRRAAQQMVESSTTYRAAVDQIRAQLS